MFVGYVRDDPQLSPTAARTLDTTTAADESIIVPAVTLIELRYLVEKGKFSEADFVEFTGVLTPADSPFVVAPIDEELALRVGDIPRDMVGDPWDRMIAATALTLEVPLVTRDANLHALKAPAVIW